MVMLWPTHFFLSEEVEFMVRLALISQFETQGFTSAGEMCLVLSNVV